MIEQAPQLAADRVQVELACASVSLPVRSVMGPDWRAGLDDLYDFVENTGYANLEVHHTPKLIVDLAEAPESSWHIAKWNKVVGSQHQTFNYPQSDSRVERIKSGAMSAILPSSKDSVKAMQGTTEVLATLKEEGRRPNRADMSVFYADILRQMGKVLDNRAGELRSAQPAAAEYRLLGGGDSMRAPSFRAAIGEVGLNAVCLDTIHSRLSHNGYTMPSWLEDWGDHMSARAVSHFHIGFNRYDMAVRDARVAASTVEDWARFTAAKPKGLEDTVTGQQIRWAIDNWQPHEKARSPILRLVTEAAPPQRLTLSSGRLVDTHAQLVHNLQQFVHDSGGVVVRGK